MVAQYLTSLDGAGLLGIVSLLVSVALFVWVVIRTLRLTRGYLTTMEELPLDRRDRSDRASRETIV